MFQQTQDLYSHFQIFLCGHSLFEILFLDKYYKLNKKKLYK